MLISISLLLKELRVKMLSQDSVGLQWHISATLVASWGILPYISTLVDKQIKLKPNETFR